jgi:Uma2 family endonuclease
MSTASGKKLLTLAEFEALVEKLPEGERVELIDGEVVAMSPISDRNAGRIIRLTALFTRLLGERALVEIQGPVRLGERTVLLPDVTILISRTDFYEAGVPGAADVLGLIEVADTSLYFDRGRKALVYATAGVAEYWIVNLRQDVLHVHREPSAFGYRSRTDLRAGDRAALAAFPDVLIEVAELLPPAP